MPTSYGEAINYSRFIASFAVTGINPRTNKDLFRAWLKSLGLPFTDDEISKIMWLVDNGWIELEDNAKQFVKEHTQI